MKKILLTLWFLSLCSLAFAGTVEDGVAANKRGDFATACKIFRKLAEQGNASAQAILGFMYFKGQGVSQDYKEAAKWYLKAEQGDAVAQFSLGVMYHDGEGAKWSRKAADQGHAGAQYTLGVLYSRGEGVPQDYKEAVKWYRKAAGQGDANAQFDLGVMYDKGQGVPQDNAEAYFWINIAASQESKWAKDRDEVAKKLIPSTLEKTQARCREWREAFEKRKAGK